MRGEGVYHDEFEPRINENDLFPITRIYKLQSKNVLSLEKPRKNKNYLHGQKNSFPTTNTMSDINQ